MNSKTPLTEDRIKKIALAYLRHYYRFRPRTENEASLTLLDTYLKEEDIEIDVMLIFCKPEIIHALGSQKNKQQNILQIILNNQCDFIATCEATSQDVKDELYYKLEVRPWIFDSLAFGLFLTTGFFIYAELLPHWFPRFLQPLLQPFEEHQPGLLGVLAIALSFFTISISALIGQYSKRFNIRYRYILALRQFHHYYADEQWVAFSEEVFEEEHPKTGEKIYWKENEYYRELYRQALNAGVGLLAIDEKENVIPIITPRRKKHRVKEARKKRTWQKIARAVSLPKVKPKTEKLHAQLRAKVSKHQFGHSYIPSILLALLFLSIIGLDIYRHHTMRPGARWSSHAAELKNWQEQKKQAITLDELQRQRLALSTFIDTPFWPVSLPFLFDSTTYIDPIILEMQKRKRENRIFVPMLPPEDTSYTEETENHKPPDSGR